jgi:hypothetical protein
MPRPATAGDARTSVADAQAAERRRGRSRGRRAPPILEWSCKESARRALGFPIPIVRIRSLRQPGLVDTAAVLGRVSLALADLLGERPEGTSNVLVRYEEARAGRLDQGGGVVSG